MAENFNCHKIDIYFDSKNVLEDICAGLDSI